MKPSSHGIYGNGHDSPECVCWKSKLAVETNGEADGELLRLMRADETEGKGMVVADWHNTVGMAFARSGNVVGIWR